MPSVLLLALAALLSYFLGSPIPLVVYVMGSLLLTAWQSRDGAHLRLYRMIRPGIVIQSLVILACVGITILTLYSLNNPVLNFSWYGFLLQHSGGAPAGGGADTGTTDTGPAGNIILGPLQYPWLIAPFIGLLVFLLPRLANIEERIFRQGTRDWRQGLLRSLLFGLAHMPVGVPLSAALGLSLGGMWFTYQYFRGGVTRSTIYHLTYNLVAVGLVLMVLAAQVAFGS